ncbi:MAG: terminase family protein, partial [Pseudanabaena sp. ELA748]
VHVYGLTDLNKLDQRVATHEQSRATGRARVVVDLQHDAAKRGIAAISETARTLGLTEERGVRLRIALVAATSADVRDVLVEGESGLLAIAPPHARPVYEPSKRRLTWPNGVIATTYSADEPDRLRGPQHDAGWCDELAAWRYPDAWDQLMFGLRLGTDPRVVVTTTPRPTPLVRQLVRSPSTHVTRGSTYDNRANLAPAFFDQIVTRYEGTRLGRQELNAEILDDAPGALWSRAMLDGSRVDRAPLALRRVVVAVDPAVTSTESSDETGIVVAGVGTDGHGYVIADHTGKYSPADWARLAVRLYREHKADRIVAESNQGGDMVAHTIRTVDPGAPVKLVHASRGKRTRAEPVVALYEQGRVHHVGVLAALEDQLCTWDASTSEASPDRLDALVWALTDLVVAHAYGEPAKAPAPQFWDFDSSPIG